MNIEKKRLVFICDAYNFKHYTRRATTEAIARIHINSIAYFPINIVEFLKKSEEKDISSKYMDTKFYVKFFPTAFLCIRFFEWVNILLNKVLFNAKISGSDLFVYLTPHSFHFSKYFKKSKNIFILSDPYHLLYRSHNTYKKTAIMIKNADIIFATSIELKNTYLYKYYDFNKDNIFYWPNCVDLSIWDIENVISKKTKNEIILGFAGNLLNLVDLVLLDKLTEKFSNCKFVIAGKNFLTQPDDIELFSKIIVKHNVNYMGYVPYEQLPEIVSNWSIGMMLDKPSELGVYVHHNKVYQYLALGLPVVYLRNISDYDLLGDATYSSASHEEFIDNVNYILNKIKLGFNYKDIALSLALNNSSDIRARGFLKIAKDYL